MSNFFLVVFSGASITVGVILIRSYFIRQKKKENDFLKLDREEKIKFYKAYCKNGNPGWVAETVLLTIAVVNLMVAAFFIFELFLRMVKI